MQTKKQNKKHVLKRYFLGDMKKYPQRWHLIEEDLVYDFDKGWRADRTLCGIKWHNISSSRPLPLDKEWRWNSNDVQPCTKCLTQAKISKLKIHREYHN